MAKMTILQIINKILTNLGDVQVTTLANISGTALQIFYAVNECLYEASQEYTFQPLEADGLITLSSNTSTYTKPSNLQWYDKDSFRLAQTSTLTYVSPQRLDRDYPTQTNTNNPQVISDWKGNWVIYPIPPNGGGTNTVNYRYWTLPTPFTTATDSSSDTVTCWIPEGFDLTLLCNWATYKMLHYRHNEETEVYKTKVWGDPTNPNIQGDYARFKTLYASHRIEDGQIMVEPLEGTNDVGMFQQTPITVGG